MDFLHFVISLVTAAVYAVIDLCDQQSSVTSYYSNQAWSYTVNNLNSKLLLKITAMSFIGIQEVIICYTIRSDIEGDRIYDLLNADCIQFDSVVNRLKKMKRTVILVVGAFEQSVCCLHALMNLISHEDRRLYDVSLPSSEVYQIVHLINNQESN